MVVCNSCGSDDVEEKSWTKPNKDDEYVESCGEDEGHCCDCGDSHPLVDEETWDIDNRCEECNEIENDNNSDCSCSICEHCDNNQSAGKCICDTCNNCECKIDDCGCEICEGCNELDSQCTCAETILDEVVITATSSHPSVPIQPKINSTGGETNSLVTFKCLDCKHEFEASPNMTMCSNCLSDNIIQHGNNNS
tara:strand:+ start:9368 stop:9949 length:582 start_codon:yes stop_codon:yes gene_type:complete